MPSYLSKPRLISLTCQISDGKIFYGVFADTDGDDPEEIGEASWLMARTCFPSEDLNGGNGHTPADVTCKWFKTDIFL